MEERGETMGEKERGGGRERREGAWRQDPMKKYLCTFVRKDLMEHDPPI